ncbi:response regulator transcription factor [Paenibacillus nasutitermitis]|uniref:Transcriptional regulatory protein YcbL n=1 Tax=Paenibacillus nasutitermitis TaxID=1652958 RepID=A0A916YSP4_9BACL|nr:response regulator transcription factor [Paenibacillus nasutitermitis]GGD59598.1 putative transcriptional regulatory protein YcbL [Paenibacillus nasutitermitis]
MAETLLLVEDDRNIREIVSDHLTREGYQVVIAIDGEQAKRFFSQDVFDLIILDLMLPGINGMDLLQQIRLKSWIPVLIVSAKDGDVDKALGLGFGADDYLAKPFSLIELTARVKAAIRRSKVTSEANALSEARTILIFDLIIDSDNFSVRKNGVEIKLTAKEFQILRLFAVHPNRVFTKAQIYEQIWNEEYYGDENVINVHMRRLREKIEDNPSTPRYIKTLWGIGYKLGVQ